MMVCNLYECKSSLTRDYRGFFGDFYLTADFLQMTVAALVTSLNPSINARQTTGTDSEEVNPRKATLSLGTQVCLTYCKMKALLHRPSF